MMLMMVLIMMPTVIICWLLLLLTMKVKATKFQSLILILEMCEVSGAAIGAVSPNYPCRRS